jgi:hypothetical protein
MASLQRSSTGSQTASENLKLSQDKTRWEFRTDMEEMHQMHIYKYAVTHSYSPSARDIRLDYMPKMDFHNFIDIPMFLDACNKSVPVYIRMRNSDNHRWELLDTVLHNYIYRRWFRPYRSDIEAEQFLCKFIFPYALPDDSEPSPSDATISTRVSLNAAICAEVERHRRTYTERLEAGDKDLTTTFRLIRPAIQGLSLHILRPLFRALLVVVDSGFYGTEDSATVGRLPVFLVRTGVEEGLSAPITFTSIADKIDGYCGENQGVVKTDLETAVDFVMGLEQREAATFGPQPDITAGWDPRNIYTDWWRENGGTSLWSGLAPAGSIRPYTQSGRATASGQIRSLWPGTNDGTCGVTRRRGAYRMVLCLARGNPSGGRNQTGLCPGPRIRTTTNRRRRQTQQQGHNQRHPQRHRPRQGPITTLVLPSQLPQRLGMAFVAGAERRDGRSPAT